MLIKWEENGIYKGHKAIRDWFENYIKTVISTMRYLHHKITSPMIEVSGSEAVSASYLNVDAALKDTDQVIVTVGHYIDKLVRFEGRWYFKERAIFIDNSYTK